MYRLVTLLIFTVSSIVGMPSKFTCIEDGFFPASDQCDKYIHCYKGIPEEILCPDGLMFDRSLSPNVGQCNYPFIAPKCLEGQTLQTPRPSGRCPRQNGYFVHEDPSICDEYEECTNGLSIIRKCHDGLVFDPISGSCKWAHSRTRTGCRKKELESLNGFICPQQPQFAVTGHRMIHARFVKQDDCRYYYICLDGKKPTLAGCPEGLVFNDVTLQCDDPLFVAGCENYYGANIYYYDTSADYEEDQAFPQEAPISEIADIFEVNSFVPAEVDPVPAEVDPVLAEVDPVPAEVDPVPVEVEPVSPVPEATPAVPEIPLTPIPAPAIKNISVTRKSPTNARTRLPSRRKHIKITAS